MMSSPPRKELKAQWKTDVVVSSLSLDELSKHSSKDNLWIAIHGKGKWTDASKLQVLFD